MDAERKKQLDAFIRKTNKAHETNIMKLGEVPPMSDDMIIPTEIYELNDAIGVGGVPRGSIIEIYGPEAAGKTTVALHIIAQAQKRGGICAFHDAEHALNLSLAKLIGVNTDDLVFHQPDYGEQTLQITKEMIESNLFDVIVIDSVAALIPKAQLEKDIGESASRALLAGMMSDNIKILANSAKKSRTAVIFINQIREKPGVMFGCFHGNTRVILSNGKSMPIRDIVNNKLDVKVLAYDEKTKSIVSKKVIDWHKNGKVTDKSEFIHFTVEGHGGRGKQEICCTQQHEILTNNGWKIARDITINDKLISQYNTYLKECSILNIREASDKQMRMRDRYDITIEDVHTYLVGGNNNGCIVHNSPEYTPGGRSLKFYASLRIEARKGEPIKEGKAQVGHHLKVKVVKNKFAPPFKSASIPLHYYKGLDNMTGIIEMAIGWGVIDQASSMYYFKTEKWDKKWQGKALLIAEATNNLELFNDIRDMLAEVTEEAKKNGEISETNNVSAEDQ